MVEGQSATPKNHVPPISSLKGELGNDAPRQMERTATKPKIAGRRRNDQSSGSPACASTRSVRATRGRESEPQRLGPHGEAAQARAHPVEDRL